MATISLGVSSPILELNATKHLLWSGAVKMQDLKTSPVSLFANSPTCIFPWLLAKAMSDQLLMIPWLLLLLFCAIVVSPLRAADLSELRSNSTTNHTANFGGGESPLLGWGYIPNPKSGGGGVLVYPPLLHTQWILQKIGRRG